MRKYKLRFVPLAGLALSIAIASLAQAQVEPIYLSLAHRAGTLSPPIAGGGAAGPGLTGVQIQNLDAVKAATVLVNWWPQSGGAPIPMTRAPIAPLASANVYLAQETTLGDGLFAVIAESDRSIAAVARTEWQTDGGAVMFSNSRPATRLIVPLVVCNYAGQTAYVSVQNTNTASSANVVASAYEFGRRESEFQYPFVVKRGTSVTFDACRDGRMHGKAGYLTAESDIPLTAQAFINNARSQKAVYAFEGVPAEEAADRLFVPLFRNNFYGTTGISVVNPGADAAEVTVRFMGSLGSCVGQTMTQGPVTVAAGSSAVFYQDNVDIPGTGTSPLPKSCAGSATIEAAGGKVVAIVNDAMGNPSGPTTAAAYNAISLAQAGRRVALPLYRNRHTAAQLTTGIQAMNVGDATARVNIVFKLADGRVIGGSGTACPACTVSIAPGASANWYPPNIQSLPANLYGAAFLESDQPLAVIVNEISTSALTDAATYNGIKADLP